MRPLLDIQDLKVAATDGTGILHGVDLRLDRGEVLGLVGESGCGKSLTGAAIMGLLPPGVVQTVAPFSSMTPRSAGWTNQSGPGCAADASRWCRRIPWPA